MEGEQKVSFWRRFGADLKIATEFTAVGGKLKKRLVGAS